MFGTSPFGKKLGPLEKAKNSLQIFGLKFVMYYGLKLVWRKLTTQSVRSLLKQKGIDLITITSSINHHSALEKIKSYKPDLLISIAGNQIFKKPLIELAPLGCLNLHTALLPKYRGLMPSFWVLRNNEVHTGVSVFFVDEGIDSGPIIVQKKIAIGNWSQNELIRITKQLGMDAILEAIELIHKKQYQLIPNDSNLMTYFSFPTQADVNEFRRIGKKFF